MRISQCDSGASPAYVSRDRQARSSTSWTTSSASSKEPIIR
jgi:hypothetical protein